MRGPVIVTNAKTAREFIAAWAGSSPRRRANMLRVAAEAQCVNAGLAWWHGDKKGERDARSAQRILQQTERAALCEALGRSVDCVATTGEMWLEVTP